MSFHFERIVLGESVKRYSMINADDAQVLAPVSKVNVFVGANNSGKSRFVRELADLQKFVGVPPLDLKTPQNKINEAKEIFNSFAQGVMSQAVNNFQIQDVEKRSATGFICSTARRSRTCFARTS